MKIYLLTRFDLKIVVDGESLILKKGEIAFLEENIKSLYVESCSKNVECYWVNIERCKKGLDNNCKYFKLDKDSVLIELFPKYSNCLRDLERRMTVFDSEIFCLEKYGENQIFLHARNLSYKLNCVKFYEFSFEIKEFYKQILIAKVKCDRGDYCYIFDKEKLLFYGFVKEFNYKDNHLIIMEDVLSCYGQAKVVDFDLKEEKCETYFVYLDDREVFKSLDIRYLFLDAIKIKKEDTAKEFLSDSLKMGAGLIEYFEEFEDYFFIDEACILQKNNEVIKVVHFEVFNNQIIDILD